MKNELDIVEQLLGNEDVAECHKPRTKKKALRLDIDKDTPDDDYDAESHVKHLDPEVKGKDATERKQDKEHWIGDCHKLSKGEKTYAGLPDEAYLYVFRMQGPNGSACVYDPVHWIYGWGKDTVAAAKDCLTNVHNYRAENPELIPGLIKGWEERLAKFGNPHSFFKDTPPTSKTYQSKNIESKTTTDILKAIGL